jgi:extracellular elastinolytic metalloproteinase
MLMKQCLQKSIVLSLAAIFCTIQLNAQNKFRVALNYIQGHREEYKLKSSDVADVREIDENTDNVTGITHVYLTQFYKGINIYNSVMGVHIGSGDKILSVSNSFLTDLDNRVSNVTPALQPGASITKAMADVQISLANAPVSTPNVADHKPRANEYRFVKNNTLEDIFSELMLFPDESTGKIILVWKVNIYKLDARNWWDVFVDAATGRVITKSDYVVSCNFSPRAVTDEPGEIVNCNTNYSPLSPAATNDFMVLPRYSEGPSFYPRAIINSPWTAAPAITHPFGWLNDGTVNFTYTRGNNVWAYLDTSNTNVATVTGSANAGASLDFNFPMDLTKDPPAYMAAATTNLFVANNNQHDVWYNYGFNEASRNFQNNNNALGGTANDYVLAECQDSRTLGTLNNANMSTPADGSKPRMQMYLWSGGVGLHINSPGAIAGDYTASSAGFGNPASGQTANIVYALGHDGCAALTNAGAMAGKIALIDRGNCTFVIKTKNAQNAGAIGVIMVDSVAGESPILMGGTDATITIPTLMISKSDGAIIKGYLATGVNGTMSSTPMRDGDLDNGVIYHEFGHGITHRLTGNGSTCMSNAERGDEGWSDWYALVMTHKSGDNANTARGMGTYAISEPTTGGGIRSYPYCYNMTTNPLTYSYVATSGGEVHSIGEVWCAALWDMYWLLINKYGYDPNIYTGTGGNNRAMKLVIDGLKLQVCSPGFLNSRDAIIQADVNDYASADICEIWNAFARRGMGYNAVQGSSGSTSDQTQSFTLPPGCSTIVLPVTLVNFNAVPVDNQINLTWKTAGEYNNAGFELQRRDGLNGQFVTIGHVSPKGVNGNGADYYFEDHNVAANTVYYYQLVQVDNDGRKNHSSVVVAIIRRHTGLNVTAFPNPADKNVNLQFGDGFKDAVQVKIIDVYGRIVYTKAFTNVANTKVVLDISKYSAGVYQVSVEDSNNKEVMRIIKK